MPRLLPALAVSAVLAAQAAAEVPNVATDITPVQSLVAMVMGDLGTPALIVRPGASPHGYAIRPSEADALEQADLVFEVGPQLTPWLTGVTGRLAGKAQVISLLDAPGTVVLESRSGASFDMEDDHDHGAEDHDDHGAEDHDAHDHGPIDPHAWLDPENARAWLGVIAVTLAGADPENAATYAANAAAAQAEIDTLTTEVAATLVPVRDRPFVVFHDAYQYFEHRFGLHAAGAIALSDASDPSPARIAELRDRVAALGATCVLTEPQFAPGLVQAVAGEAAVTGVLDPLGTGIEPGAGLYPELLRSLAASLAACG